MKGMTVTASSRIARAALALRYGTSVCAQSRAAIAAPFPCIVDIVKLRHALLNKARASGSSTAPGRMERTPTPHEANARPDRVDCHRRVRELKHYLMKRHEAMTFAGRTPLA